MCKYNAQCKTTEKKVNVEITLAYLEPCEELLLARDVCGQDEGAQHVLEAGNVLGVPGVQQPRLPKTAHRAPPVMVLKHAEVLRRQRDVNRRHFLIFTLSFLVD